MNKGSDNSTVVDNSLELKFKLGFILLIIHVGIGREAFLLGLVPILVKSSLDFLREFLGPNGSEGTEASWGLDVTDHTGNLHWWGLNDGNGLIDFFLMEIGVWSVDVSQDVGHSGFESHEGGEMWVLGLVVSWERSDLTSMLVGSLSWKESKGTVSGASEFSMRHLCGGVSFKLFIKIGRAHV